MALPSRLPYAGPATPPLITQRYIAVRRNAAAAVVRAESNNLLNSFRATREPIIDILLVDGASGKMPQQADMLVDRPYIRETVSCIPSHIVI